MTAVRKKTRAWAGPLLVAVIALLVAWQLTNQIRLNHTNARLAMQASNGQKALVRSCRLAGVSRKIYVDELQRHVITVDDFALFASTLKQACSPAQP